jgi:hypothetical protein
LKTCYFIFTLFYQFTKVPTSEWHCSTCADRIAQREALEGEFDLFVCLFGVLEGHGNNQFGLK